ncbi:sugar porter family MFS transporter [Nakamurella flava]|uniref:Sugar porter family MFS transporter n=1 Tax=Nakamurella flava TaxID=2576308 RepID=A0A4U6QEG4_9ACTN|nr:sugar porter family MFS transporter [Nakamurella flava]TKV58490.1 sugar porter family MFS transporter [Nakamurella flava]
MGEHGASFDGPSIYDGESENGGSGVIKIAVVAALGGFLFGYDSSVINGANAAITDKFQAGPLELGFTVAAALLGAAAGALLAGRLADKMGRVAVMKIAAVLFFLGALGTGFALNLEMLILFRLVGGFGVGIASVIAPAYIAEIAPASIRGRLGSLQQLAIVTGIAISLMIDYGLAHLAGDSRNELWLGMEAWRWMFLAMAIPAVVYGALALTIPESPRYLIAKHRIPEAKEVLTRLLGPKNIDEKIEKIRKTMERETEPSWKDLRGPSGRIAGIVWVGLLLSVFQQFVGINVIFYYSNVLWEAVGFSESQSFIITVITSIINIATTLIAIASIDKVGRKPLLIIGSLGMTVTLGIMALIFGTATVVNGTPDLNTAVFGSASGIIALFAANLFVVAFGMSWGPVVWVLLGEMFPNRMRAAALSLAAGGQWVANWLITVSFPYLKDLSLGVAYGLYALFALLSFFFVSKWVQETKGRQLEDMQG